MDASEKLKRRSTYRQIKQSPEHAAGHKLDFLEPWLKDFLSLLNVRSGTKTQPYVFEMGLFFTNF